MKLTIATTLMCLLVFPVAIADEFQVEKTTITLKPNGKTVAVKIHALQGPVLVHQATVDNTPTGDAGFCNNDGGFPITCENSTFALVRATINDADLRPGKMPICLAANDKLAIRHTIENELGADQGIPLEKGDTLTLFFRTYDDSNKVRVEVSVGYTGGIGDLQLWSEAGGRFDPCGGDECCEDEIQ